MPDPVPPPKEWQTWKPVCKSKQVIQLSTKSTLACKCKIYIDWKDTEATEGVKELAICHYHDTLNKNRVCEQSSIMLQKLSDI